MKTQYVKITKIGKTCPNASMKLGESIGDEEIGKIFPVFEEKDDHYRVTPLQSINIATFVHKDDCIPVNIQELPFAIGQEIEVSDDNETWLKRKFVGYYPDSDRPFIGYNNFWFTSAWKYARRIQKPTIESVTHNESSITIGISGHKNIEVPIDDILEKFGGNENGRTS